MNRSSLALLPSASAWTAADYADPSTWTVDFSAAQVDELATACDAVGSLESAIGQRSFESLLPGLTPMLDALAEELKSGRGFVRLRGLPLDTWGADRARIAFWMVGSRFGAGVTQTAQGSRMVDVTDVSGEVKTPRQFKTSQELRLHTDPASDLMGLACIRDARSGGDSVITSGAAVHDEMLRQRPDLLALLYEGFHCHRFGEGRRIDAPVSEYKVPVFARTDGALSCRYVRSVIVAGQKDMGQPLTDAQVEALDLFDKLAGGSGLHLSFRLQSGDMLFVNNLTVLHARTQFVDHEAVDRRRHILRLWLDGGAGFRAMPAELNFFNGGACGIPVDPDQVSNYDMESLYRDPASGGVAKLSASLRDS